MEYKISHNKALELILAGKAIITLKNAKTGNRFTYRIKRMKTGDVHNVNDRRNALRFISVLTGPENTSHYSYFAHFKILGGIDFDGTQSFEYKFNKDKAKVKRDCQSVQVFEWVVGNLVHKKPMPSNIEIWHNGHCCRCGRVLTVPESIEDGIGPECKRINSKK